MNLREKSSISARMPLPRAISRSTLAAATAALAWACMDTASTGGSQSQTAAVRVEAADPLCRIQTHLIILDEDAIANGRDCVIAPATGKDCKQDEVKSNSANERFCYKEHDKSHERNCSKLHEKDFDDKDKVSICHIPPGNPGNPQSISVGAPAVKAHLDHGDKLGNCPDDNVPGNPSAHCEKSYVGNRANLTAYANLVGQEVTLPAGSIGDEGWFAVAAIRIAWKSAGPETGDGL
ncbi:MAG: hypothetical protein ABIW76_03825, partial [Fibrobacteria bacterium]